MSIVEVIREKAKTKQGLESLKLKGKRRLYPYALEVRCRTFLKQEIKELKRIVKRYVDHYLLDWIEEVKLDSFEDEFKSLNEALSIKQKQQITSLGFKSSIVNLGHRVGEFNEAQQNKIIDMALGTQFLTEERWFQKSVDDWVDATIGLWDNVTKTYIEDITKVVQAGIQAGDSKTRIISELRKVDKSLTVNRANLIARDQIGKLNGEMTKNRNIELDINMYIWQTSLDERVRGNPTGKYADAVPSHWEMENRLCRWDNPNVYSDDGGITWLLRPFNAPKAHPGEEIQCRCSSLPYFGNLGIESYEVDEHPDEVILSEPLNWTPDLETNPTYKKDMENYERYVSKNYRDLPNFVKQNPDIVGDVEYYTNTGFIRINDDLWNNVENKHEIGISTFINQNRLNNNLTLYRSADHKNAYINMKNGQIMNHKGFMSTSTSETMVNNWSFSTSPTNPYETEDRLILEIKAKKGQAFAPAWRNGNINIGETEFIGDSSMNLKKIGQRKVGNRTYVIMEVFDGT
jgi:uncharacterized protein with gpF-like domain